MPLELPTETRLEIHPGIPFELLNKHRLEIPFEIPPETLLEFF